MKRLFLPAWLVFMACACNSGSPAPRPASDPADGLSFAPPTDVKADCAECYEPGIAADAAGRIFVTAHRAGGVAVSPDGGRSFAIREVPDPPTFTRIGGGPGDDIVNVAPWGWLYYTELWSDLGGSALAGVHLAYSTDGGQSWEHNQLIHARNQPLSLSINADRQWLAFEGDSTVHLFYNCGQSVLSCAMRSDDRGRTWSAARSVVLPLEHTFPSPLGAVVRGPDGSLIAPYYALPTLPLGARTMKVAASTDGGRTFRQSAVYTHPAGESTSGGGWPGSTILRDGAWVVGWSTADGRLWLAASRDRGASWSAPTVLDTAQSGNASAPWLEGRADGGVDAVWFTFEDGEPGVRLGRFAPDLSLLAIAVVPEIGGGQSDYPHFTHTADGRVATAYLTPGGKLRLAISNR